jgi:hypothetical protein
MTRARRTGSFSQNPAKELESRPRPNEIMEQPPAKLDYAPSPRTKDPPCTPGRLVAIWCVAIAPALIGLFHLHVHPLWPPHRILLSTPASPASPGSQTMAPNSTGTPTGAGRAGIVAVMEATSSLVFLSCTVACLILGLLRVRYGLLFAFMQAWIMTFAYLVSDGQGACVGPIAWTLLPFWPAIGLGKMIGKRLTRSA